MSLIYRAVWQDRRDNILSIARETFEQWVYEKSEGRIEAPILGLAQGVDQSARIAELATERQQTLFATHHHELGDATWTLTLGVVVGEAASSRSVWVDLEHTAEDPYGRPPPVSAPRVVKRLIASGDALLGGTKLTSAPHMVTPDEVEKLALTLLDPSRLVPIIAFSSNRDLSVAENREQVRQSAEHLAGAAVMAYLHPSAEAILEELLPPKMGVFGGAARIYLPGIDPVDPKPWRHRWYGGDRRSKKPLEFPQLLARELSPRMALRRPPRLDASALSTMPLRDAGYFTELLQRRDNELERVELQYERTEVDRRYLQAELDRVLRHALLERHSRTTGPLLDLLGELEFANVHKIVDAAKSLPHVTIGRSVVSVVEPHESNPEGPLMATRLGCALAALHEFSLTQDTDFLEWVERCQPVGLTPDAITMRKGIEADPELPVDFRVDPSGFTRMGNQIRSSAAAEEGLVVRFHDDRNGETQKIHIGYIGDETSITQQKPEEET